MSAKPRVLVGRKLPDAVEAVLKEKFDPILNPDDRLYSQDELLSMAEGVDAILPCHTEQINADLVSRLPDSIKIVANYSVGVDHCDLEACKARGIVVTNTPDVLSDATAEIALLLMLGAARRAGEGEALVRTKAWKDWSPSFMVGSQVTGKRLGIIGMGRVGQVVAKRAAAGLDMDIHYHNRSRLAPDAENGAVYYDSVEALLPNCDVLSLHCPATPESQGLLNAERIALLPDGAIIVNTARGAIIHDDALIAALESGKIRAAGLDVFNGEPENINSAYRGLKNTFLLPHIGSATEETRYAMGLRAIANLEAFFSGSKPHDRLV